MLRKWEAHFILLLLVVLMLNVSCSKNTTTQSIAVLPSDTLTTVKPIDTPVPLSDLSSPSTMTDTPIIPTPTVELPFAIVRISPSRVGLSARLAREAQKAYTLGYTPVIEFDASW